ncbi:hypothetical protein [Flavobacterium sp. F52]|uniref:hypothetical protein n=1 Tax=Flavobacterium sp. F52 TaxID=1202532 RepID=UPI00027308D3|nr:hypothetical protein [Flavobacterium sp. F52]EJG02618.1 hypothetical protein FF52_05325 [Flavobacterium sp. F52]
MKTKINDMHTKSTLYRTALTMLLFLLLTEANAQIGIGTITPDPSSILDISSTAQGMLAPRMSTAQRTAIASPAESLLVFDTTDKAFYFYNAATSAWIKMANESTLKRTNYKLVKSAADLAPELAAGGGSSYLLNTNTLYEINGTISLTRPININNAYVSGLDANEDVLSYAGVIFQGNTGGSIRNLTLRGATAFAITGPGAATSSSLLVQNVVIDGMSSSVGSISGIGLYFGNIIQFVNNANGITYSNIGNLLLNNQAWASSNNGTFETFTGTFGLIQKNSGFSTLNGADVAIDVSSATLSVGTGVLLGTVFSGTTTNSSGYINRYAAASTYPGYNFSTAWTVDAPGIPREGDADATGDINLDAAVGAGTTTSFTGTGTASRVKLNGTTTSNNLFRFTRDGNNRITYRGNKTRYFQVNASVSYQGTGSDITLILYIARNGVVLTDTKVYGRPSTGFLSTAGILALPVVGTMQLKKDDYIEIWAERYDGTGGMSTVSLNLSAR